MNNMQDVVELDLVQMAKAIWHRLWAVALAAVLFGGAAFLGTYYLVTPLYRSSALMYVNNSAFSLGSTSFSISSSELSAAQSLVDTYIVILKTRTTLNDVIAHAQLDCGYEELRQKISASAVNSTEIFEIVVTDPDPLRAEHIANAIASVLPKKIADVVDGSSVRIVDHAVVPSQRSSPSYTRNTMIGVLLGIMAAVAVIVVREMFDVFIRSEQYLTQNYDLPLLAVIPDMHGSGGGSYYARSVPGDGAAAAKEAKNRVG